ncbi:outer membrane protein [Oricola sp.]|uniref:outer membrane protein n=1 Tax=Oricola sp. TaxID=1979950 RepID=UPI003BACDC98
MRLFSKLTGGAAMLALAAAPAMAADAIDVPPAPPAAAPIEVAPPATWSGFYAGGFAGYGWGTFDSSAGDIDADGFKGGAFAGYNLQDGRIVYGVEGDIGYSDADGTLGGGPVAASQTVFGSVRGRVGYALDPVLLYGTAGLAVTGAEVTDGAVTDSNTHVGWTVGAGADALLTENIFGRLEYRYTDYQSKNFTIGGPTTVSSGFSTHTVNTGIGIKF